MKERGFSLVELIVVMFIFSIIMIASGTTFQRVLFGVKSESKSVESNLDKLVGAELIRLDLEHTGFGIARNTVTPPIAWNETGVSPTHTRQLTLRSTLNNSNQTTLGWQVINCTSTIASIASQSVAGWDTVGQNNIVLLDENENFIQNTTLGSNCPAIGLYTAYPYDAGTATGCAGQYCNQITYSLGGNAPATCAPNTRNLIRTVGGGGGDPIINCVADMKVLFDLDSDGDGDIDTGAGTANLPGTTSLIIDQVKNINVYILFQIGQREQDFVFSADTTLGGEIAFDTAAIPNFTEYRWKVIKLTGRPMGWQ
ncbi:MAG: prepilin-type N-terminal cleavage/methylation domain-containing protein [Desulfobulbaceae bacterium]|nr:prepilin-type N-terminal cleavage/methylation domain-containing protein [Desulfobulbaceae bacterium]HIJ79893.1 prepilin-type N-terminal cleavage/methylation domain-containing protein [Deltaproteobacteria bacterium]